MHFVREIWLRHVKCTAAREGFISLIANVSSFSEYQYYIFPECRYIFYLLFSVIVYFIGFLSANRTYMFCSFKFYFYVQFIFTSSFFSSVEKLFYIEKYENMCYNNSKKGRCFHHAMSVLSKGNGRRLCSF